MIVLTNVLTSLALVGIVRKYEEVMISVQSILAYLWRIVVAGLVFVAGLSIGSMGATAFGSPMPDMPTGADSTRLLLATVLTSPLLALAVA
jgi:hypothetical protein